MKIYRFLLFAFTVGLASCSTTSLSEENGLYTADETKVAINISDKEKALVDVINEYRVSIGLSELIIDPSIYTIASDHNAFMIEGDTLGHTNFGIRSDKVKSTTNAKNVSENVARFFNTNQQVLKGWLDSPSHKATLEGNHTHTVISIAKDSNGYKYYTQLFYN